MLYFRITCGLVLAAALASCSPSNAGRGTTFTDSAGVTLALAEAPLWSTGEGWRFAREPLLQIGALEGPEEYQFTELVAVARMGDGRIVVADRGASELKVFGPDGGFLYPVGREGEGPGEFRRLEYVGVFGGDSLATFDRALRRVQIFGPGGEFVRSCLLESWGETAIPDKIIDLADDSTLAIRYIDFGTEVPNGIARWPHEIVTTLDLRTGRPDSVAYVPGSEASVQARPNGGYSHGQYIFGKGNEFSARAGRIALISTDTFSVRVVGVAGLPILTIRREVQPDPVTDDVFERYVEGTLGIVFPPEGTASPGDVALFRQSLFNRPRASTLPILRSVQLDAEGNVWVERDYLPGEDPPPYLVFRSDGTWLGEVAMPPALDRGFIPYQAPYFQIGSGFLLGLFKDELDVQYVRLYELVKGSGA
jgi:hypothetical protein